MFNVVKKCKKLYRFVLNSIRIMEEVPRNIHTIKNNLDKACNNILVLNKARLLPSPIKSENDSKEYIVIQLKSGLIACLVSDTTAIDPNEIDSDDDISMINSGRMEENDTMESDDEFDVEAMDANSESGSELEAEHDSGNDSIDEMSTKTKPKFGAVALCIRAGSFNDPKHIPGLAHLLEHMISMGSKKFPKENYFEEALRECEGEYNAETKCETTTFHFDCLHSFLIESLNMFAQFFLSPSIKKEALTRERQAVESEFQAELFSDGTRIEQLLCSIAKKDSPVHGFGWGNLITLKDNIGDDELHTALHQFKDRYYSPNRMTLAIQAPFRMHKLLHHVVGIFGQLENNGLPVEEPQITVSDIFDLNTFHKIYCIQPAKAVNNLNLIWAFPSLMGYYKTKPSNFFGHLLEYKGIEGLHGYLIRKHWINSIEAGDLDDSFNNNRLFSLFSINIDLTATGYEHIPEIIETIFAYLKLINNEVVLQRSFDEIKKIGEMEFRFSDEVEPTENVQTIAEALQNYASEDILCGDDLFTVYEPAILNNFLNNLKPDNVHIQIVKDDPNIEYDMTEKWFGTKYTVKDIPYDWLNKWKNFQIDPTLNIPLPNMFITTDFSILPEPTNISPYPEKIFHNKFGELWYRQDVKFGLPEAYYYFYLISPVAIVNIKHRCLLEIMKLSFSTCLSEECASATDAGLNTKVSLMDAGLVIKCFGYNQHLQNLLHIVFDNLIKLSSKITQEVFDDNKDRLLKVHYNRALEPSIIANDIRLQLLTDTSWNSADLYKEFSNIQIEDIHLFIKHFLSNVYVKTLIQGNVSFETAFHTIQYLLDKLKSKEIDVNGVLNQEAIKLDRGEKCFRIKNFNKNDSNSFIYNYYQCEKNTPQNSAKLELVQKLLDEPLFDTLRTKEQLGYDVSNVINETYNTLGFSINIQSSTQSTNYLNERIEIFLKHTHNQLYEMYKSNFDRIRKNMIIMKQVEDINLEEEVEKHWQEIFGNTYMFDREKLTIDMIETVTLNELLLWWKTYCSFGNRKNFRKLTVQVVAVTKEEIDTSTLITNQPIQWEIMGTEGDAALEQQPRDYFIKSFTKFKEVRRLPYTYQ